jgi:hypothetical protein
MSDWVEEPVIVPVPQPDSDVSAKFPHELDLALLLPWVSLASNTFPPEANVPYSASVPRLPLLHVVAVPFVLEVDYNALCWWLVPLDSDYPIDSAREVCGHAIRDSFPGPEPAATVTRPRHLVQVDLHLDPSCGGEVVLLGRDSSHRRELNLDVKSYSVDRAQEHHQSHPLPLLIPVSVAFVGDSERTRMKLPAVAADIPVVVAA